MCVCVCVNAYRLLVLTGKIFVICCVTDMHIYGANLETGVSSLVITFQ